MNLNNKASNLPPDSLTERHQDYSSENHANESDLQPPLESNIDSTTLLDEMKLIVQQIVKDYNLVLENEKMFVRYARKKQRNDSKTPITLCAPTSCNILATPYEYNVNPSSIRRERIKYRQKIAKGLKQEFKPGVTFCIHWDGKMLEDITGKESVDRLPILVSGTACRHHILEIMLEAVVVTSLGTSSGPDILIFKRFQKQWEFIYTTKYQTSRSDDVTVSALADIADERITFAKNQLQEFQPRDDYKELLNLVIVFLGGVPVKEIFFRAPAGLHRARWMAKAIYALKIWMFRGQFQLTKKEEKRLLEICIFTVRLYITAWYQAPGATLAPILDLQLLKDVDAYKSQNAIIYQVALKKFMGHLWYLSEELVALAFFADKVSSDTKRKMVRAINNVTDQLPVKQAIVDAAVIQTKKLGLYHPILSSFSKITGISSQFLEKDVEMWIEDEEYQAAKCTTRHMKVVNDIAERGVALMDEYNKLLTNDEEQKQFLLLVVQKYRQRISVIGLYKEHNCLWKTSHPDYHNKVKRNLALQSLVDLFKTEDPTATKDVDLKKLNSMRGSFRKELNKTDNDDTSDTASQASNSTTPRQCGFKRPRSKADQVLEKNSKRIDQPAENPAPKLQFSSFGDHVAEKLRSMPPEMTPVFQKLIGDVLFYGEMQSLNMTSRIVTDYVSHRPTVHPNPSTPSEEVTVSSNRIMRP
ncbi:hypothetical protein JTE90_028603 [Oedothorax gibbosus]|uniref:MADF domain-containing protein n=1 Tax=Oedothorax gibbosus TaxID=931172 RepID=A0AAV6TYQ2_9ARAC|nr:hypothetical protein JTE90_028603 [Oedothorax gibbosus]